MLPFKKLAWNYSMAAIKEQLAAQPELWDQFDARRTASGSPHSEMTDIWVRYNDPAPFIARGDFAGFNDAHIPVWLPAADKLPAIKPLAISIMGHVKGEMLGGILLTKLPPGGRIARHTDAGWHAKYFEKFYVPITAPEGARFCWDAGSIEPDEGSVWWFRNDLPHWVENDSDEDRLAAIICIRTSQFQCFPQPPGPQPYTP